MVFCQNCGTEANEGSKFCSKCGNSLEDKISDSVVNNSEISTDSNAGLSINDSVINRSTITNIGNVILEKEKVNAIYNIEKARKLATKGKISRLSEELEKASLVEEDNELLFLRNLAFLSQKDLRTLNFEDGFKAEEYLLELYEISSNYQKNLALFILFRENHYQSKGMNHPEKPNTENLYDLLEIKKIPSEITKNLRCSKDSLRKLLLKDSKV